MPGLAPPKKSAGFSAPKPTCFQGADDLPSPDGALPSLGPAAGAGALPPFAAAPWDSSTSLGERPYHLRCLHLAWPPNLVRSRDSWTRARGYPCPSHRGPGV
jgi:hypothetical protein